LRIEESSFGLRDYNRFEQANATGIAAARARQQAAFEAERQDWVERGLDDFPEAASVDASDNASLPAGCVALESPVPGNVWKVLVGEGEAIRHGDPLVIIESMKTEMQLASPASGPSSRTAVPSRPGSAGRAAHSNNPDLKPAAGQNTKVALTGIANPSSATVLICDRRDSGDYRRR